MIITINTNIESSQTYTKIRVHIAGNLLWFEDDYYDLGKIDDQLFEKIMSFHVLSPVIWDSDHKTYVIVNGVE